MIVADDTRYLRIVLGGAITTNQLPIAGDYLRRHVKDTSRDQQEPIHTVSNSTTEVTVLAAADSGYRHELQNLSIYNADTVAATVSVKLYNGTTDRIVLKATLAVADTLHYEHGRGWYVTDTNGNMKINTTNALLDGTIHSDTAAAAVTRGSLIYGNSTPAWDELVIGSARKFLQSDGTDVSWQLGTLDRISETTAATTASIAFTDIGSTYRFYIAVIRNLKPATDNVSLLLTLSTDNGSNYLSANYRYVLYGLNDGGTGSNAVSASDSSIPIMAAQGNAADESISGVVKFMNMPSTANRKQVLSELVGHGTDGSYRLRTGAGGNTTTSAVTAVKFAFSSGDIASGTIALYGVV